MLQFRFRLDKLLELRKYEERQWELKLAKVVGECLLLRNNISDHRKKINLGVQRKFGRDNVLDVNALIEADLYIDRLYREIDALKSELEKKNRERAEIAGEYLERSRKRKVLDKLKERRAKDYYKEQLREEFKVQDDINNSAKTRDEVIGGTEI